MALDGAVVDGTFAAQVVRCKDTLVNLSRFACPDPYDRSKTFDTVRERCGVENNSTDQEMKIVSDEFYLEHEDYVLWLMDQKGNWSCVRDPLNKRGDEGSTLSRQRSIETLGLLLGIREGPALRPAQHGSETWWLIAWATLLTGMRRAYLQESCKKNRNVQMSVHQKIERCKALNRKTSDDAVDIYIDYYDVVNKETTATNFLQVHESTEIVESGFKRRSPAGWTT